MNEPTYTVLEISNMIGKFDQNDIEILMWLVNDEKKLYSSYDMYRIYFIVNMRFKALGIENNKQ